MNKEFQIFDWEYTEDEQLRVDKFLAMENEQGWTRTQIQNWIKEGYLEVNGKPSKPNYKLQKNDQIRLKVPAPKELAIQPEPMDLDIVYEDADLLVVNKPKGMVVHPSLGHYSGTLVNGLLYHCQDLSGINGVLRPGIVHRLDKDTSGLLMVAKHDQAHLSLAEQLKAHTVKREYIALVTGRLKHAQGTIDAPIGRDPKDRQRMGVVATGKQAITHFQVLESFADYTLVRLRLETGRTHQIRVHMKYIGHPIVGDPIYGPSKTLAINGQALHAQKLGFIHPRTKQYLEFESKPPKELLDLISGLRENQL